jgi:hypothetical protein
MSHLGVYNLAIVLTFRKYIQFYNYKYLLNYEHFRKNQDEL